MKTTISKRNISVIIPAYNEAKNIRTVLLSLKRQSFKDFEVLLVDDCSLDNTVEVAEKFKNDRAIELTLIKKNIHLERGVVRNLGAKTAKGKHLFFLDADMELTKNVLSDCIEAIKSNPDVKGLIIPEESFGEGFWAECRRLERRCYLGDDSIEAARFFEKKAFLDIGGWDNEMVSGEDWDLTKRFRKRYNLSRIKSKIFHNEGKLTLWQIAKKKFYYASKAQVYLKKYPLSINDLFLFIFRPAYFRNWRLFLSDPIHGIGVLIIKFIEIIAGGLGFLYSQKNFVHSKLLNPR